MSSASLSIFASSISSSSPSSSSPSSAMVLSLNIVRSSFIFIILAALITSHVEMTTAKSLGLAFEDDFWSQPQKISKRNSWWSKKSLDSSPKYQALLQESGRFLDDDKLPGEDGPIPKSSAGDISILYDCYTQTCVPDFVSCTKRSRTRDEFNECKATHRLCALQCWVASTELSMDKNWTRHPSRG